MQQTQYYPLLGGLDLITPAITTKPGHVIAGVNYEPVMRGYQRVDGYERYDGQPSPSAATYWVLNFTAGTATIAAGATVTGATSGATGKALVAMAVTSGTFGASNAVGYLVLITVTGTFVTGENLQVAAVTKCVTNGAATVDGATNDTDQATWAHASIDTARALVAKPAGSGAARGVWAYNGNVYCFRDNAGATAGGMFKATTAGWASVALGRTLPYTSGGAYVVAVGDTITGAISGATAVVKAVIVASGSLTAGTAVGRFIFASQTGTFQAENLNVGANLDVATIAGNSTAITLPLGGRYEFINHNFYGAASRFRMYGCNGVGTAFEFDGTTFVPIVTGMPIDTPNHIAVHKNQLFLSFPGGSIQNSSIGVPVIFAAVTGSAEIGMGDNVTAMLGEYLDSLTIFCRNKVSVLYGNNSTDFVLAPIATDAGAVEWTAQKIQAPIYLDDRGLRDLRATQAYGDFNMGTVTQQVSPIFAAKRKAGVTAVASVRVRSKDQYRLFWSDGTGLTIFLGRKGAEALPFDLGVAPTCACSSEDANGNEILFFGDSSGWVYQLDSGTSFDGVLVDAYIRLPFNNVGSPQHNKRWHKATLEVDAPANATIGMTAEFSYGDPDLPRVRSQDFSVRSGGGFWNEDIWNGFQWSAPVEGLAEAHIDGIGKNISVVIASSAIYETPHTIHGITLNFSPRGLAR